MLTVILSSLLSLAAGLYLVFNPRHTIELQRIFYEKINWKIEPVSMPKELRNTRIMGYFLIILAAASVMYYAVFLR